MHVITIHLDKLPNGKFQGHLVMSHNGGKGVNSPEFGTLSQALLGTGMMLVNSALDAGVILDILGKIAKESKGPEAADPVDVADQIINKLKEQK